MKKISTKKNKVGKCKKKKDCARNRTRVFKFFNALERYSNPYQTSLICPASGTIYFVVFGESTEKYWCETDAFHTRGLSCHRMFRVLFCLLLL